MKKGIFALFLLVVASSCSNKPDTEKQPEIPKALNENESASYRTTSKRRPDDLVESLYGELVEKDSILGALEDDLATLAEREDDSTKAFNSFNSKNVSYYDAATQHLNQISDSNLKQETKSLITRSLADYTNAVGKHDGLLKLIKNNNTTIQDLHVMLKVVTTLAVMEKYQRENMPASTPLEGFVQKQEAAISKMNAIVRKR